MSLDPRKEPIQYNTTRGGKDGGATRPIFQLAGVPGNTVSPTVSAHAPSAQGVEIGSVEEVSSQSTRRNSRIEAELYILVKIVLFKIVPPLLKHIFIQNQLFKYYIAQILFLK